MIQPRILRAGADIGNANGNVPRVGYIEPGHWGGGINNSTGFSLNTSSVTSDWIILTGYTTFMLRTNFSGLGHLQVGFEWYSRMTNAVTGPQIVLYN